jgi:formylglycine-generating enzyme required for sulfatase activity
MKNYLYCLALAALLPALTVCENPSGSGDTTGDTTAPGPVSGVWGWYNKASRGISLVWDEPADEDLREIRLRWDGGAALVQKGEKTWTIPGIAENRGGPAYTVSLTALDAEGNESGPVEIAVRADVTRAMISVPGGKVPLEVEWGLFTAAFDRNEEIPSFLMGATEITYELWHEVYTWAVSADRGADIYTFTCFGAEGSTSGTSAPASLASPTDAGKYQPAAYVSYRDALVWCNAYSEKTGKAPVYYQGNAVWRTAADDHTGITRNEEANGYRLPSMAEWEYAARGAEPSDALNAPWTYPYFGTFAAEPVMTTWYSNNSGNRSHPVAELLPNTLGLYDMAGNVYELNWYVNTTGTYYRSGGSYTGAPANTGTNATAVGSHEAQMSTNLLSSTALIAQGFRVVCAPER